MTNENNQPFKSLRDGRLKITIWRNETDKGVFYRSEPSRSYKDQEGAYQDANSYTGDETLRMSRLLQKAYDVELEAKAADWEAEKKAAA